MPWAVGRFLGRQSHDIIAGRSLLPGGDVSQAFELAVLPAPADLKRDLWWCCGDIDGNGMDDLIRKRDWTDREGAPEIVVHFSARTRDEQAGFLDDDLDGLPDDWETGRIKPAGIDLAALGCKPGRSDLIIEIERFNEVDVDLLQTEVSVTRHYFASLPVHNPDGTLGISVHPIFRDPTPHAELRDVIAHCSDRYPPREHIGAVHSMFCGAPGDPDFAVVGIMSAWGRFLLDPRVHDVMSHELGHELGLTHEAFQPPNSPIYPSVMSYAYITGPGGNFNLARYSDGRFCSLVLDERNLSERLPFPADELRFLSQTPYMFRLESAEGKTTRIDWNRNGVFGELNVVADINYSGGTSAGALHELGRCDTAPVVVTHGTAESGRLLVLYGQNGSLRLRHWRGTIVDTDGDNWSPEVIAEPTGVLGEPSAVHMSGSTWAAYRMAGGVVLRRIDFTGDEPEIGAAIPVAGSDEGRAYVGILRGRAGTLPLARSRPADRHANGDARREAGIRPRVGVSLYQPRPGGRA